MKKAVQPPAIQPTWGLEDYLKKYNLMLEAASNNADGGEGQGDQADLENPSQNDLEGDEENNDDEQIIDMVPVLNTSPE